jgi:hypothetical protein
MVVKIAIWQTAPHDGRRYDAQIRSFSRFDQLEEQIEPADRALSR